MHRFSGQWVYVQNHGLWCDFFVYSSCTLPWENYVRWEVLYALFKNVDIFYNDHIIPVILEGL